MSVTYQPEPHWGNDIQKSLMLFDQWQMEHRHAMLEEQLAGSRLQQQQAQTDLLKTEGAMEKGKLGEFNDTSKQRLDLLNAQVQGAQNTAAAEGSKAALMKNQEDRIPLTNAHDDELYKAAKAKADAELTGLGLDNNTKALRLTQETPQFAAQLKQMQVQTSEAQQRTEMLKAETDKTQQSIAADNMAQAMKLVTARASGDMSQSDFENLKQNAPGDVGQILKSFSGNEAPPKTMDEAIARFTSRVMDKAQAPDATDTQKTYAAQLMAMGLTRGSGAETIVQPKPFVDPKTGKETPSFEGPKQMRDMGPVINTFQNALGAFFQKNSSGPSTTQPIDVTKQGAPAMPPGTDPVTGAPVSAPTTTPTTQPTATAAPTSSFADMLGRVNDHINANPDVAKKSFYSNLETPDVKSFIEKAPRDVNNTVKPGETPIDEVWYNRFGNQGMTDESGKTPNPFFYSKGDEGNIFKTLSVKDTSATAAQEARYRAALGSLAGAMRPQDLPIDKGTGWNSGAYSRKKGDQEADLGKGKETLIEILKTLHKGPDGITGTQANSLLAFGKHFGWF